MEAAEPIQIETPMTCIDNEKINFIEELIINFYNFNYIIN